MKCQSTTRWSSRSAAVSALYHNFGEIVEILIEIVDSDSFNHETVASAESKLRDIMNFEFFRGLTIWSQLLHQINVCNIKLQAKESDINMSEKHLSVLCQWLEDFSKTGFENCFKMAKEESEKYGISQESGFEHMRRGRGMNPKFDSQLKVDSVKAISNIERFKADCFDKNMSELLHEKNSRFTQIRDCVNDFKFLWGKDLRMLNQDFKRNCVKNLCENHPNDLNYESFCNELQTLHFTVKEFLDENECIDNQGPLDTLNIIYINGLESAYMNCEVALRIFLTIPVSVASNERAFSKLKLIKNYKRSSRGQVC